MTTPSKRASRHAADLRGFNRLVIDAITGTADLVEAMHAAITHLPAAIGRPAPERTSGLTGWVYGRVRDATRVVGAGVDASLARIAPVLGGGESGAERDALLSAMNGVLGEYLDASANPLAITMQLRSDGQALPTSRKRLAAALPDAGGHIVVLLHGLCMNDRQWQFRGHDHGAALARDLGFTPVYLHYNSGRHISRNGRDFARVLERLVRAWPVPVERIVLIGHSMGGLVARSACYHAEQSGHAWLSALDTIAFLGTPHQGAPLERLGTWIDRLIGFSPYSAPFTRLGRLRGAGIQDLRHGNVRDRDWQAPARDDGRDDPRTPLPLPAGVRCHALAGTTQSTATPDGDLARLRGDGLVPVASALGWHPDPAFDLRIPKARQWVGHGVNHLELLGSAEVYTRLKQVLVRRKPRATRASAGGNRATPPVETARAVAARSPRSKRTGTPPL